MCYHENNVPTGYHHNGFVATHEFGHMRDVRFIVCPHNKQTPKELPVTHVR